MGSCSEVTLESLGVLEEQPPDQSQCRNHDWQCVPENIAQETWHMDFLMFSNGFDHEIGPVPDVSIGSKEDRTDAHGEDIAIEPGISQEERDFDLLGIDRAGLER